MGEEQRSDPRYSVSIATRCQGREHESLLLHVRNLSDNGFLAFSEVPLAAGDTLGVAFHILSYQGEEDISCEAKVVHSQAEGGGSLFGAHIEKFADPDARASFRVFLMELVEDL